MLLLEWEHWLRKIVVFETEDKFGTFTVAQLADSGWEIKDREDRIQAWIDLIHDGRPKGRFVADETDADGVLEYTAGTVRRTSRRVAEWIQTYMHGVRSQWEKPKD